MRENLETAALCAENVSTERHARFNRCVQYGKALPGAVPEEKGKPCSSIQTESILAARDATIARQAERIAEIERELSLLKPDPQCDISCILSCSMEGKAQAERIKSNEPPAIDRDAVIEECAKVCDLIGDDWIVSGFTEKSDAAYYLATSIRALKSKSPDHT